jgi:hypothetical protein
MAARSSGDVAGCRPQMCERFVRALKGSSTRSLATIRHSDEMSRNAPARARVAIAVIRASVLWRAACTARPWRKATGGLRT